ncbi:gamma-glutamyltransferase [Gimesia aquarii]|uniref:Glutathione hydrolase proenzyme n=1 Tax=Gimesia aquarii TaxID=2527964 RepID=A0A517W4Q8_9PLAN|nr:gamma-glutamyltransferase [Gimesia aquarii]QDU00242.1 Putative gamma-glutamyltransferase YwrD [Gimesia aquarii]
MRKDLESRSKDQLGGGYDRPYGLRQQSRSIAVARHGMVATSQPLAAQVGLDVLKSGGNAVDAAIAVNAMLGVVEPMSCGIGGDLFAIYWDAKSQKLLGLNASGRSPSSLSRDEFSKRELKSIPDHGLLSWSVPGCVSGWETLHTRFGTQSLADLLSPSIKTAEEGFPVTEIIAGYWKNSEKKLSAWLDSAETFLIDGHRAPCEGELFCNPRLAHTYQLIADKGKQEFYQGSIAKRLVEFSQNHGGFFSLQDLADHRDDWIDPVSTSYRRYDIWELPPSGQGIAALEMLNLLEEYDLASMGPGSAEYLHLLVEAKKLAYADRAQFYADPDFEKLPVDELISKAYADRQRKRINPDRAAADVPAGDPKLKHGDTVYLSVVDKDRNFCSLIQSNYFGFGSQVTPGDLGFAMQNRGSLFALDKHHLNRLEPNKRPFHTIIPAMVTQDGRPWFCFGVMGGDMQPQGHVQVLVNLIDFKMNVQAAGDTARVRHFGDATPTGELPQGVGTVVVESGISDMTIKALQDKGHHVLRSKGEFGGYQGILIDWEAGVLKGATESRKDGVAVGY